MRGSKINRNQLGIVSDAGNITNAHNEICITERDAMNFSNGAIRWKNEVQFQNNWRKGYEYEGEKKYQIGSYLGYPVGIITR